MPRPPWFGGTYDPEDPSWRDLAAEDLDLGPRSKTLADLPDRDHVGAQEDTDMPTPTFKNEAEAISQLDAINLDRPGEITISLTASEVSNIGALLDRAAQGLLPAVLGGNELALRLASDTVEIADKLRKLAVAKWG